MLNKKDENIYREKLNEDMIQKKLYGGYGTPKGKPRPLEKPGIDSLKLNREVEELKEELNNLKIKLEQLNDQKTKLKKKIVQQRAFRMWLQGAFGATPFKIYTVVLFQAFIALVILFVLFYSFVFYSQKAKTKTKAAQKQTASVVKPSIAAQGKRDYFAVQVAEYADSTMADKYVDTLRKQGYEAYLYKAGAASGRPRSRVYIGKFFEREEAVKKLAQLKQSDKKFKDGLVRFYQE